jgi:cell division protein ZapE
VDVRQAYEAELAAKGFKSDPAQLRAVDALERCAQEWGEYKQRRSNALKKLINRPQVPRGVYMYGGVGRGKSFLMDCFFNAVPLRRKVRLHFHEFMREVHRELAALQGTQNPLDVLGARIAKRYKLICFDEFHVADITDAMILHRLLAALFDNGVGFVTTSNFKPDELYPGGLHRDRILPAIDLLNARMDVVNVDNGTDYRRRALENAKLYHSPLSPQAEEAMRETFEQLAEVRDEDPVLLAERLPGDRLAVPHRAAVERALHAREHGLSGPPLHLAGGRALR